MGFTLDRVQSVVPDMERSNYGSARLLWLCASSKLYVTRNDSPPTRQPNPALLETGYGTPTVMIPGPIFPLLESSAQISSEA